MQTAAPIVWMNSAPIAMLAETVPISVLTAADCIAVIATITAHYAAYWKTAPIMAGATSVIYVSIPPTIKYVPDVMNTHLTGSIRTWVPAAIRCNVPVA
jgi:hypothetical protein